MTAQNNKVRIGCASAFYGDSQLAARQLVEKGDIDYLVFDYLAEVTMAILAKAKSKKPELGYAMDFVTVAMADVLSDCIDKGIKIVANAGGVNVPGCIAALQQLCEAKGVTAKIAGVYGDDLSVDGEKLAALKQQHDLSELQTGEALPERLASINAYLGAAPIRDALAAGADIVVTGRVVDSAVVIGPLMHEFGWQDDDYHKLSQAALAGHVIECGAQCTGGNFTDWRLVPDFSDMSYPIAEVEASGNFIVDIPPNTGGLVSVGSVAEQIVYEIGDPANYLLPDVACDWTGVKLEQVAENRVAVSGAKGRAPGDKYKVCATYVDGFKLAGTFFMGGLDCAEKARTSIDAWVKRCERFYQQRGLQSFRNVDVEIIGAEDTYGPHAKTQGVREVMAKYGLHHNQPDALKFATMEMPYLATSATPGMSGFGAARQTPTPVMKVHSCLLDKAEITVKVQLDDQLIIEQNYSITEPSAVVPKVDFEPSVSGKQFDESEEFVEVPLVELAYARSGDKGDNANIGVIARKAEYLPYLYQQLTAEAVAQYFAHSVKGEVERFALPGFNAFNFLMTEALGGGGTASLRVDNQGKALAQMLLSKHIRIPQKLR